jgi:hypothetical protein
MLTQLTLSRAITIQVAPYNSVRVEAQVVYDVGEGETAEAARAGASAHLRAALIAEAEPVLNELSSREAAVWRARLGVPGEAVANP